MKATFRDENDFKAVMPLGNFDWSAEEVEDSG